MTNPHTISVTHVAPEHAPAFWRVSASEPTRLWRRNFKTIPALHAWLAAHDYRYVLDSKGVWKLPTRRSVLEAR